MNKNGWPDAANSSEKVKECDSMKTSEVPRNEEKFISLNADVQIDSSIKKKKKVQERCQMPVRVYKPSEKKAYVRKQVNT